MRRVANVPRSEPRSQSRSAIERFQRRQSRGLFTSGADPDEEDFPNMRFMPHTEADVRAMLATIGAASIDELIAHVPANLRDKATIALAPGMSEQDIAAEVTALASQNRAPDLVSFLGGGYYNHYVPAVVRAVTARAEFATSYTPYQAA